MVRFLSFTSGSCGNCSLLLRESPAGSAGLLIDAGVSLRRLKRILTENGLSTDCLKGVLVTHDHLDHIRHLGAFCKSLSLPVFATGSLHASLAVHTFTRDHIASCRRVLPEGWNEIIEGFEVRYFPVPHDATETVGFAIRTEGHRFLMMTDLGEVPAEAMDLARQADTVVIESNYDIGMLLGGSYTYTLKMRICKGSGHLSNDDCADAIRAFYHPGLRNLFLCHLSGNNNTPRLAYDSALEALSDLKVPEGSVRLRILPRGEATPLLTLD